jgi:hypothetical protein
MNVFFAGTDYGERPITIFLNFEADGCSDLEALDMTIDPKDDICHPQSLGKGRTW